MSGDGLVGARVVVVGGGIAGLATAALLARGGARVTLLERHERVGGRAGMLEVDGFRFDTGPSWYFMPEVFAHFFELMGERVEDHLDLERLDPAYRVFFEPPAGAEPDVLDVTADPEANWAAFDALEPGAGERMRGYAAQSSDAYRMALDHFLYTTFARPDRAVSGEVLRRLGTLAGLLGTTLADRIARTVTDPRLRQVLGYHAVFLGSSPYRVPALYSLMSHLDLVDGVRFPRGGMYTIIEAIEGLARAHGVEIRTGTEVAAIDVEPEGRSLRHPRRTGRARGVRLADGEVVPADVVVSAADLHHTETRLLEPQHATRTAADWERRGPGISALLVLAGVRGELPELAHHSLFFTRDWPGNFRDILGDDTASGVDGLRVPDVASMYVSRTTATDPDAAPPGHENIFVLVPFPADPALGGADDRATLDAHADRYLDQAGAWMGTPDLRERVVTRRVVGPADFARDLSAWRGTALGMEHTLAQSAMFRPGNASPRVPNLLHVGGSTIPGVGLPMCLISAELVAKRLLGDTSAGRLPAPLRRGSSAPPAAPAVDGTVTGFVYLGALLVALAGLAALDRRYRLAFWVDARRAAICVAVGVVFFLAWDVAGLALGIFARGESPHMTGVLLAPDLPLEEAFFLALLSYNALLAWRALDLAAQRRAVGRGRQRVTGRGQR
ncbi:phytoene desaturase family protein [Cellulomonas sp. ATA003]|uniref:phytoene desaturase family protein n=1 Tax=Cellulomonas sp. ATA003 TaxID=3073064 RepID=UPI002873B56E|nr:phytoene desaturase family protein [Cellulomonas sp. ATA003]WNB85391.1 phytoene desaturase family protein [Cellulomonas sp. ATA003]